MGLFPQPKSSLQASNGVRENVDLDGVTQMERTWISIWEEHVGIMVLLCFFLFFQSHAIFFANISELKSRTCVLLAAFWS